MDLQRLAWEKSYARCENFMFYPKEETVKFLNRHVRKRTGIDTFRDVLQPHEGRRLRGLDFGCGIGRNVVLFEEFGIEGHGVDISAASLHVARKLAEASGFSGARARLHQVDGIQTLPYDEGYFDFATACGVLDSMPFVAARRAMRELDRIVRSLVFVDLISGDSSTHHAEYAGEETVATAHEEGTIQSYFNYTRIQELLSGTGFSIRTARLMTEQSLIDRFRYSRYHLVLERGAEIVAAAR